MYNIRVIISLDQTHVLVTRASLSEQEERGREEREKREREEKGVARWRRYNEMEEVYKEMEKI